jgi:hypothetical protein
MRRRRRYARHRRDPVVPARPRRAGWDWTQPAPPLDAAATNELLEHPDDAVAPPGYEPVRRVLSAAAAPPRPDEWHGDVVAAASFVTARHAASSGPTRRPPVGATRRRRVLVGSACCLLLLTGTAVAASTGTLPTPAQEIAHDALTAVGFPIPAPDSERAPRDQIDTVDADTSASDVVSDRSSPGPPAPLSSESSPGVGSSAPAPTTPPTTTGAEVDSGPTGEVPPPAGESPPEPTAPVGDAPSPSPPDEGPTPPPAQAPGPPEGQEVTGPVPATPASR